MCGGKRRERIAGHSAWRRRADDRRFSSRGVKSTVRERRVHRRVHPVRSTKVGMKFKKHPLFPKKQRVFCRSGERRLFGADRVGLLQHSMSKPS